MENKIMKALEEIKEEKGDNIDKDDIKKLVDVLIESDIDKKRPKQNIHATKKYALYNKKKKAQRLSRRKNRK